MVYYLYCFQLRRNEEEFFNSPLKKVLKMLDISRDESMLKNSTINNEPYTSEYFNNWQRETNTITSMKEVEGFL